MLRPKEQIESGLKKTGIHLADDAVYDAKMNLTERMTHYKVPSVSIAVIDENELKLTSAYNSSPETIYQAGSVSKPVAALIALLVAEKKGLDLDEDVNQILARTKCTYRVPESEFTTTDKVTLRRLLSHTAGLTLHGFDGYPPDTKELPTTQQILEGEKSNSPPVTSFAVPGTIYKYSGGGTTLVQLLLEAVTGKEFSVLAKEYLFDPLKMKSSGFEIHRPGEENFHPAIAHDHQGNPIKEGAWCLHPESAAAGLWTTPADLARFMIEIQKASKGERTIISQAVVNKMLEKQNHGNYGLGPEISGDDTALCFQHGGITKGFQCFFMGFTNGKGAVIMTNSDNGTNLIKEIIPSIAATYAWPEKAVSEYTGSKVKQPGQIDDPAVYKAYEGDYLVLKSVKFKFATEDNKLVVYLPFPGPNDDPRRFELTPELGSETTSFFHISDNARFEFVFPSRGAGTFTSTLGPGERAEKELKSENQDPEILPPSIESKSPLSSTSQVALVMPIDRNVASTDTRVATSEQSPGNEPPTQTSDKSSVKEAQVKAEDAENAKKLTQG